LTAPAATVSVAVPTLKHIKVHSPFSVSVRLEIGFIILPVVLYGYETWSLTLREEHGLRVFENRVVRRMFGRKGRKCQEGGENGIMRSFIIFALH
jgi:hypothetical protein